MHFSSLSGSLTVRPVVGSEYYECVLAQVQPVEFVEQPPYGLVFVGYERGVALGVDVPLLVVIPCGVVYYVRLVRCVVGQVEEEGVVLVAVYEADGVVGRYVGVVAHVAVVLVVGDVDKLLVVEPPVGIVVGTVGIGRAYEPAVELVEATVERCGLLGCSRPYATC